MCNFRSSDWRRQSNQRDWEGACHVEVLLADKMYYCVHIYKLHKFMWFCSIGIHLSRHPCERHCHQGLWHLRWVGALWNYVMVVFLHYFSVIWLDLVWNICWNYLSFTMHFLRRLRRSWADTAAFVQGCGDETDTSPSPEQALLRASSKQ